MAEKTKSSTKVRTATSGPVDPTEAPTELPTSEIQTAAPQGAAIGGPVSSGGMIRQRKLTPEEKIQFGIEGPIAHGFAINP